MPRSTGANRIDNVELYDTLYVSGAPAGAVAECFGWFDQWGDWLLEHPHGFDRRLVTLELDDAHQVLNLDDADALRSRGLRPSRVVTRDRTVTQGWAGAVYGERRWAGVAWWSFHNPDWASAGVWCAPGGEVDGLEVIEVEELDGDHVAVRQAATALLRPWTT